MPRALIAAILFFLVTFFAGCTMVETADQRNRRVSHVLDMDTRMMVQDLDTILLLDHNTRLTRWHAYVGY
jgi:transcription termination factor Rho